VPWWGLPAPPLLPWKQRARCGKAVLEVSDGHPPGGNLVERPSSRGAMECSPARRVTEPLAPPAVFAWSEQAFAPNARKPFVHTGSPIRAGGTRWHACLIIVRDARTRRSLMLQ
jgi:hypothetical protein